MLAWIDRPQDSKPWLGCYSASFQGLRYLLRPPGTKPNQNLCGRCTCSDFLADTGEQQERKQVVTEYLAGGLWVIFSICKLSQISPAMHFSFTRKPRKHLSRPLLSCILYLFHHKFHQTKDLKLDNTRSSNTSQASGCSCLRMSRENRCMIKVS